MAEYVGCRNCDSPDCHGCNMYTLSRMLNSGKFDGLMNGNRSINPFADVVEVKHGRWIVSKEYNDVIDMNVVKYTCSACGEYRLTATTLSQATNYCPNCGARMDGE